MWKLIAKLNVILHRGIGQSEESLEYATPILQKVFMKISKYDKDQFLD